MPLLAGGTAAASPGVPPSQQDEDDDDTFNVADSGAPVRAPRRAGRSPRLIRLPVLAAPNSRTPLSAPQRPLPPTQAGARARHNGIGAPLLC
jgi:hypothetical protein